MQPRLDQFTWVAAARYGDPGRISERAYSEQNGSQLGFSPYAGIASLWVSCRGLYMCIASSVVLLRQALTIGDDAILFCLVDMFDLSGVPHSM